MALSAIAGLASAAGAAATIGFATVTFAQVAIAFAVGAGLSAVSRALMPKPSFDQMRGLNFNVRDPQSPKKLIYGRARLGGTVVAMGSSGTDNSYLTFVIALAGHRIEEFEQIWLNDDKVWDTDNGGYQGTWGTYVQHNFLHGYDNQTSSTLATAGISGWGTNHKLNGNAAIVIRLFYDAEVFTSGVPNVSVVVKGNRVYDPRQDSTSSHYDSSVGGSSHRPNGNWNEEGYLTNPALVLLDYILDEKYGLGESIENVNLQSVVDAANICDEDVSLDGGGTQKRYTCDGVLDTANTVKANIENILSSMIGTLTLSAGQYVINAHAYRAPSLDINEDILIAPLEVATKQSRRNIYNAVKGSFVSEEENYVVADYPSQVSSTYATADGETIYLDMPLPMTTNNIRAQRIARLTMLKSRLQTSVTMTLNLTGLKVKVGDNIRLTNTRLGYTNKVFEIINYNLVPNAETGLAVQIDAVENDSAAYSWSTSDEEDFTVGGTVSLYDGTTAQPVTSLSTTASTTVNADGTVNPAIEVSWTVPTDAFTDRYEITWQNTTDSGEIYKQTTLGTPFIITGVLPSKAYQIKVYAINELGVKSTAVTASTTTPADFVPKVPSIYRITKANANAPTTSEFNTAAGRDPKNKDAVITKDTSTTPDSTHAWTYNASTSAWDQDDDFITGDLIVNGSITGDQITANSIQVNKLTGDVTELYPLRLTGHTITTTTTAGQEFSIPAPELSIAKRQRVLAHLAVILTNSSSSLETPILFTTIQKLSKGASATSVATVSLGSTISGFVQEIYMSGNQFEKIDGAGSVSNAADGSGGNGTVNAMWYDSAQDRTYMHVGYSSHIFSNGDTLYFNEDAWTSSGTWFSPQYTITTRIPVDASGTTQFRIPFDIGLFKSTTATRLRFTNRFSTSITGVAGTLLSVEGTVENIA